MTTDRPEVERARLVLQLVLANEETRARFLRAYTGSGNGLDLLRQRAEADPVVRRSGAERARLEAHQRVAFARPTSPEEHERAAEALVLLHAEREQRTANERALDAVIQAFLTEPVPKAARPAAPSGTAASGTVIPGTVTPRLEPQAADESVRPPARRTRGWIAAALVLCVAIGAATGAIVTSMNQGPATSAPGTAPTPSSTQTDSAGNPAAADKWFTDPQTPNDLFPYPSALSPLGIDPTSVRKVQTDLVGSSLWIATTETDLCLLWTGTDQANGDTAESSCATREEFTNSGLSIVKGGDSYHWDGVAFTIALGIGPH